MFSVRSGSLLRQVVRCLTHSPFCYGSVPISYSQYKHSRRCLQNLLSAVRYLTTESVCHQPQRSQLPADGPTPVALLRMRLGYRTASELRRFWLATGDRLTQERASHALRVLDTVARHGVEAEQMKRYPILLVVSKGWLQSRLEALLRLPLPLHTVVPLLKLPDDILGPGVEVVANDAGAFPGHKCRLDYLECQLESGYERLCVAILKNPIIMVIDAARVIEITRLLIDNGVSAAAILDDPYIYKHNIDLMRSRLAYIREVGLAPIRPWMLRCLERTLKERVERFQLFREIMSEYEDEVDYLSNRLGLPRHEVSAFEQRYANALRLSPIKMKAIVDVLLSYGYTGVQVAAQPRVLCYSTQRTRERCERLRTAGVRPASLLVLCKTPRGFDHYMATQTGRPLAVIQEEGNRIRLELEGKGDGRTEEGGEEYDTKTEHSRSGKDEAGCGVTVSAGGGRRSAGRVGQATRSLHSRRVRTRL